MEMQKNQHPRVMGSHDVNPHSRVLAKAVMRIEVVDPLNYSIRARHQIYGTGSRLVRGPLGFTKASQIACYFLECSLKKRTINSSAFSG